MSNWESRSFLNMKHLSHRRETERLSLVAEPCCRGLVASRCMYHHIANPCDTGTFAREYVTYSIINDKLQLQQSGDYDTEQCKTPLVCNVLQLKS